MKNLNKKYRCFIPFDNTGNPIKSETNEDNIKQYDPNDAWMFCSNGKIFITKINKNTLQATILSTGIYKKIVEKFKDANIKILDCFLYQGEGTIDFNYKDMDKVAPIVKAKKQSKFAKGLFNRKQNYKYFLRIMRNISDSYRLKLEELK